MTSSVWQLRRRTAQLQLAQVSGRIDLSQPAHGLTGLRVAGACVDGARLLGIELPSVTPGVEASLIECQVRGPHLVALYQESDEWPVRVDARWTAVAPPASGGPLAMIELTVSVQTRLLDSRPELSIHSAVPSGEVLRPADESAARFETVDRGGPSATLPEGLPACLLFRLPGADLSYAEMVHPLDFGGDRLQSAGETPEPAGDRSPSGAEPGSIVHLHHPLFRRPLEKGVILRARVCGALLRRRDDTQVAAECYAQFIATGPPLGA